jgi:hypothetical protein
MEDRLKEAEFKTAVARELIRVLVENHDHFVTRNREAYFRGICMTIGQVFVEDNPTIQRLLLRPKPTREGKKMPTPRIIRGSKSDNTPSPTKVRVFKMSEIRVAKDNLPDPEKLKEEYPTMAQLRVFAKDNDYKLPPNLQDVDKAVARIVKQAKDRASGKSV